MKEAEKQMGRVRLQMLYWIWENKDEMWKKKKKGIKNYLNKINKEVDIAWCE